MKSSIASIGKGDPFRKNHSFLFAIVRVTFARWENSQTFYKQEFIWIKITFVIRDYSSFGLGPFGRGFPFLSRLIGVALR